MPINNKNNNINEINNSINNINTNNNTNNIYSPLSNNAKPFYPKNKKQNNAK